MSGRKRYQPINGLPLDADAEQRIGSPSSLNPVGCWPVLVSSCPVCGASELVGEVGSVEEEKVLGGRLIDGE